MWKERYVQVGVFIPHVPSIPPEEHLIRPIPLNHPQHHSYITICHSQGFTPPFSIQQRVQGTISTSRVLHPTTLQMSCWCSGSRAIAITIRELPFHRARQSTLPPHLEDKNEHMQNGSVFVFFISWRLGNAILTRKQQQLSGRKKARKKKNVKYAQHRKNKK